MRVTLQTIADATGADRGTVSRVLSGRAREYKISAPRAKRIRDTAKRLGYRANELGRALRSGRNCDIGLLLAAGAYNWLPERLLAGILDGLAEAGYTLRVGRADFTDPAQLADWARLVRSDLIDGLLIAANRAAPGLTTLQAELQDWQRPVVWLTDYLGTDTVLVDTEPAARAATEHLIELGHRRIDYLGLGWPGAMSDHEPPQPDLRYMGYAAAMAAHDLPTCKHYESPAQPELQASLGARLALPERPTALLCHGDQFAIHSLIAAATLGLRVPEDLSIMSLGSIHGHATSQVTRYSMDEYERGRLSADLLHQKLLSPATSPALPHLSSRLTPGHTTAPPPT